MKRKTLLTLVLSLLLVVGVVGGTFAMSPKAVAQESNPEWLSSFTMLAGAEVRTADPNGIRFTTQISASEYNALMAKVEAEEYQSVEFGTLICPVEYAEDGAIKDESNEHVTKLVRKTWDVEYNPTLQTDVYQYNGDLMGLTAADLVREYQALGYCTITTAEGDAVTYYASVENEGDNVRSPLYVAAYNVSVFGSENEYLLAMIDSAMAGKTLTLSQTSASLTWKQVIDFPIVATVDGLEVSVIYYVEDESIASYENGKLTALKAGTTNIVAALPGANGVYTAKVPVTVSVDASRFDGLESKTITEQGGSRSVSSTLYYEKGVGLWIKVEANHNAFKKGWGGTGLDIDVKIAGKQYWLYYGTNGIGAFSTGVDGVGMDLSESTIAVTKNPEGSATAYSTLMVALIREQTLLADGVSQDSINKGTIKLDWLGFKSPDETSISNGELWLVHGEAHVCEEGYFIPQPEVDLTRFEGLEVKTANPAEGVNLSSVMVYEKGVGLWVKVDATHNLFAQAWGGGGLNFDITVEGIQMLLYYGTNGPASCFASGEAGGFDMTSTRFIVEGDATTGYTTAIAGLIPNSTLLEKGVSQAVLDKGELSIYAAFSSPGEGWWYIHSQAYVGEEGYFVPAPVEPEVTIDVTRFEGLETKAIAEQDGTRNVTATMVYEKGVGLWVKVEAQHNVLTKGTWAGNSLNIEVAIGSQTYWLYYAESGLGTTSVANANGGFNLEESAIKVTENAEGAAYTTLMVGLIPEATLLADGAVSQETINEGYLVTAWFIFKSVGEGSFTTTNGTTTNSDNWVIFGEAYVGEEGFFVPTPVEPEPDPEPEITVDLTRFEGLEAKTVAEQDGVRTLSSVMVYEKGVGLWVKVDANHNVFTKGWGGSGLDLELNIGGVLYWLYFDTNGPGSCSGTANGAGFDMENTNFVVTENETGAKYTTLIAGLIPEATLTADGIDVSKGYISVIAAFNSPSEGSFTMTDGSTTPTDYWYIHREAYVGTQGYFVPAPVVVDPFAELPTTSLVANDGSRVLTSNMYYEQGVGLWVKVDAQHNKFAKGWAGGGLDLDITVEGVQIILYYGTSGPASCFGSGVAGGFDMSKTTFEVTEDSGKYITAIVGLIPSQTLLDMGVSQATLDRGYLKVTTAFKSPGEGSFVDVYGYSTPADWWYIHRELLVGAKGYLTGGEKVKTMSFADSTTKKAFDFSATLTEYGLYVHAEVKADAIGDGLIAFAYYTNYWQSATNTGVAQFYLGRDAGIAPTWKRVTHFTGINAATYGYGNYLVFEALYDWTFLGNLGLMSYDSANKMESTIYISPSFCSGEAMSFNVAEGDGSTKEISSTEWRFGGSQSTAIDSGSVKYITLHVTKNGIAN